MIQAILYIGCLEKYLPQIDLKVFYNIFGILRLFVVCEFDLNAYPQEHPFYLKTSPFGAI